MRISDQKQKRKSRLVIVSVAALVLAVGGATALAYSQKWWPFTEPENHIIEGIDYGPPTEQEVENSQNAKKDAVEENTTSQENQTGENNSNNGESGNSTTTKQVSVAISFADVIDGNVEVRAFIVGVIEGTGTCTATLTHTATQPVTKSSQAFVDASTSQCQPIMIPVSSFDQDGEWTLVVTYKSPTSSGQSEKMTINI